MNNSNLKLAEQHGWIGPFPCKPTVTDMSLWMSFGPSSPPKKVQARAKRKSSLTEEWISASIANTFSTYQVQVLTFSGLEPNTEYQYEVIVDSDIWVGEGLCKDDFIFKTLPDKGDFETVFMSCHGIEAYEKAADTNIGNTWEMWKRLNNAITERDNIRLGILGGDQVYMDDTFTEDISNFDPKNPELTRRMIYDAYLKYWGTPEYRRVMVKLPCYLMWDDHDIIDGWGSRKEQLNISNSDRIKEFIFQKIFKVRNFTKMEKWRHYGSHLFVAFDEMQASRNPTAMKSGVSSFIKNQGEAAILALDMRRERGTKEDDGSLQILSASHQIAIDEAAEKLTDCSSVFIVSPVTLARMSGKIEFILGSISNFMWQLGSFLSYRKSPLRVGYWSFLFLVGYWILYSESEKLPGVLQALSLMIFLLAITIFNHKNINEYFPNTGKQIKAVSYTISAILFGYGMNKLLPHFNDGIPSFEALSTVAHLKFHELDSVIGSGLSVLVILYFTLSNWSKFNTVLKSRFTDKKSLATCRGWITKFGIAALVTLSIFNWWRGLPGIETTVENLVLLIPYALLGICVFIFFLMALLEGMGVVDTIAGLNDDVMDAWSAPEHARSLKWFRNLILKLSDEGRRKVYLLCGDIHTGGLSEISFKMSEREGDKFNLYQITSSPVSYVTMPALVEKITSGVGTVPLKESQKKDAPLICEFTNVFFRSQRNFVILKPENGNLNVSYYFEDLEKPVVYIL
ncbi:hypothetical protein [Bdellovibrio bacteriovorus]|uniref:hypothetical protein n=1 Tax=Bdellovibrio bacteriovorus TaxID=959 RepID=UPI0035A59EF0